MDSFRCLCGDHHHVEWSNHCLFSHHQRFVPLSLLLTLLMVFSFGSRMYMTHRYQERPPFLQELYNRSRLCTENWLIARDFNFTNLIAQHLTISSLTLYIGSCKWCPSLFRFETCGYYTILYCLYLIIGGRTPPREASLVMAL